MKIKIYIYYNAFLGFLMLYTQFGFSAFPQMEKIEHKAQIYDKDKNLIGYSINKIDGELRVETNFNNQEKILKKSIYTFLDKNSDQFLHLEEYEGDSKSFKKKTFYEYVNQRLFREKIIEDSKIYFIDYSYTYQKIEKQDQITSKIISYKDSLGNLLKNYHQQKIMYEYYLNGKIKKIYSINFSREISNIKMKLQEVQIFRNLSNENDKIESILRLNEEYIPFRYIEYVYSKNPNEVAEIKVYKIKDYFEKWNKDFKNIPNKNLDLMYYFKYQYLQEEDNSNKSVISEFLGPKSYLEEIPKEKIIKKDLEMNSNSISPFNIDMQADVQTPEAEKDNSIAPAESPLKTTTDNTENYDMKYLIEEQKKIIETQKKMMENQKNWLESQNKAQ